MRPSSLTVALVSVLLITGVGIGGALAATGPLQPQESPAGTTSPTTTTPNATGTPAVGTGTTTVTVSVSGTSASAGTSVGSNTGTTVGSSTQPGPSITFNDQQISGHSVVIQSVRVTQPGFIVIYDSTRSGNKSNQIIGSFHLLGSGTFHKIPVPLDTPINQSTSLTAVIHLDTNHNGQFDYVSSHGNQDKPLMENGRKIVDIAQVSPQTGTTGSANQTQPGGVSITSGTTGATGGTHPASGGTANASGGAGTNGGGGGQQGTQVGGPGFGLVVTVAALLAVALLAVRRN